MLNLYFVFGTFGSIFNISFHADDNDYGVPSCRGNKYAKEFSAEELEVFLASELRHVRQEATLYASDRFESVMVQRVIDSLNQQGWLFHMGKVNNNCDLPGLEAIACCNCRDRQP